MTFCQQAAGVCIQLLLPWWLVQDVHQKGQEARYGSVIDFHPQTPAFGVYHGFTMLMARIDVSQLELCI